MILNDPSLAPKLLVRQEEELEKETSFPSAVSATSYDAMTPLSIARLHETTQELRRTQESLRQDQLLAKLESKGHLNKVVVIKDKQEHEKDKNKDVIKDNSLKQASTHTLLMEHVARPVNNLASSFQIKKLSRREQILALFVRGVDVSIKDIAARIKGCSEKTIQRELNALLYDNVIERIGEKRWSRYILR
jgi:DeoR/GlpR family transcriptional regulator of sugar metabolism